MAKSQEAYKKLKAKIAAVRKKIEETAKSAFKDVSAELFAENPDLISFGWKQRTPYFNDGDECVFSALTDEPAVSFKADGLTVEVAFYGEDMRVNGQEHESEAYYKEYQRYAKEVTKFLGIFEDDDLKAIFGDHVEVTVTRNGSTTEEYNHD